MSRHLAIGDIHGCFEALQTLIEFVEVSEDDTVVTLGDYVDRGPSTKQVIDWLLDFEDNGNLIALRGNHEIMMLNARINQKDKQYWGRFGAVETLESYARNDDHDADLVDVPDAHWHFLSRLQKYYETHSHIFVHAIVSPQLPLNEQTDRTLFWEQYSEQFPGHESGKIVVCGHKSQDSGLPATNGKAICIDTNACKGGWLTCLDVESETIWQANQMRETRKLHVNDL